MIWSVLGGILSEDTVLALQDIWLYPGPSTLQVLEMGARAAVLLLVALLLSYLLRKDGAIVRQGMWRLTMIAALLLPILGTVAPRWEVPLVPLDAFVPQLSPQVAPLVGDPLDPSSLREPTAAEAAAAGVSPPSELDKGLLAGDTGRAILVVWAVGSLLSLLWVAFGVLHLALLVRGGRHYGPHDRLARLVAARLGLRRKPRVFLHERVRSPIAFGVLRSHVLLPAAAIGWNEERLRVVLLHELMHVRRRDGLHQMIALLVRALYWPIPLTWSAVRAVARERELACDERVVASGERPSDYASHLLAVARQARVPVPAMAMAEPSRLEERVLSILRTERPRSALAATVIVGTTLVLALPTLAGVDPWTVEAPQYIAGDGRVVGWSDDYLRKELDLGNELLKSGDLEALKAHYRRVLQAAQHVPIAWFRLGYAELMTGNVDAGLEASARAARYTGFRPGALYNMACGYARIGDEDSAVHALELSIDSGLKFPRELVLSDSDLAPLHDDRRFQRLVERLPSSR